jgi:hypothetical protein
MELRAFATPLLALSLLLAAPAARAGNATADEATAMVRKGVAFIKAAIAPAPRRQPIGAYWPRHLSR